MATVDLEEGEWQQVITALAMSNPLVVKIATQLQRHYAGKDVGLPSADDVKGVMRTNSGVQPS